MLLEALQQLELATEVVVVVARREVLVHPLASQLRVERVDEDGWLCAATHRSFATTRAPRELEGDISGLLVFFSYLIQNVDFPQKCRAK